MLKEQLRYRCFNSRPPAAYPFAVFYAVGIGHVAHLLAGSSALNRRYPCRCPTLILAEGSRGLNSHGTGDRLLEDLTSHLFIVESALPVAIQAGASTSFPASTALGNFGDHWGNLGTGRDVCFRTSLARRHADQQRYLACP